MSTIRIVIASIAVLFFAPIERANAHDLGLAQVNINTKDAPTYRLEAKLAASVAAKTPVPPEGCRVSTLSESHPTRFIRYAVWAIDCTQLFDTAKPTIKLPWKVDAALILIRDGEGQERSVHLRANGGFVHLPVSTLGDEGPSSHDTFGRYFVFGFEHILSGADHLAVLVCLCLIATGWRLVQLITAFTLGHSLTLALGLFGWINFPSPPVEALIALSVAFLASEAFATTPSRDHGFGLVSGFGLLHGLGFAGALSEAGLSQSAMLMGLLAFNIGVELGQIAFVLAIIAALYTLDALGLRSQHGARATAFAIGSIAMFWTFNRIASFVA